MSFKITDLTVKVDSKIVLEDINLELIPNQLTAIMGPNGSGKSSLAQVIAGNPNYQVVSGKITWQKGVQNINILGLGPDQRAALKMFVSFQNPPQIEGLKLATFLKEITLKKAKIENIEKPKTSQIIKDIKEGIINTGLTQDFYARGVNDGFSGGEKRKFELLQFLTLKPVFSIFDEIDSGLDLDAIKKTLNLIKNNLTNPYYLALITHNPEVFDSFKPDRVVILKDSKIREISDSKILKKIKEKGFQEF
jgi:Fe-S cluster assembly ATP-binding protein